MAILARFTVETACGCCEGDPPYLVVGDCESLTGTATLCGFSGYSADDNPYDPLDPWAWEGQLRKWKSRALSGGFETTYYSGPGCDTLCVSGLKIDYAGAAEVTCEASTPVPVDVYGTCVFGYIQTEYHYESLLSTDDGVIEKTLTQKTITYSGTCYDPGTSITTGGTTDTLEEEQYWYDALAAGDGVEGDSCCASTEEADETEPESTTSISATLTAVRRPVYVGGCTAPATVTLRVTFSNGTEFLIRDYVGLCGATNFIQFPQPGPGKPSWCWQSIELV